MTTDVLKQDQDNRSSLTSAHVVNGKNNFSVGHGLKRPVQTEVIKTHFTEKAGVDRKGFDGALTIHSTPYF